MTTIIFSARTLTVVWIVLIGFTLGGMAIGESVEPGFRVTAIIAVITALKGRMVIDYFLELGNAHPAIRRLVRLWGFLVPALMILTYFWGPQIARLTRL